MVGIFLGVLFVLIGLLLIGTGIAFIIIKLMGSKVSIFVTILTNVISFFAGKLSRK